MLTLHPHSGIIALRCLNYVYGVTENYEDLHADEESEAAESSQDNEVEPPDAPPPDGSPMKQIEPPISSTTDNADHHQEDDDKSEIDGKTDMDEDRAEQADSTAVIEAPHDLAVNDDESETGALDTRALAYPVQYWIEHAKLAPVDVIQEFRTSHPFWND